MDGGVCVYIYVFPLGLRKNNLCETAESVIKLSTLFLRLFMTPTFL